MAELRFSGGGSERRRRMLVNESDPREDAEFEETVPFSATDSRASAFPLLSRDRLIRRFISPRLWKHAVLTGLWILFPVTLAVVWMNSGPADDASFSGPHALENAAILRGLSGLELFLASQFCLLICWVRSASAVDFCGGYRSWRWMSMILFFTSLMLVTGSTLAVADLIAGSLEPLLGTIRSARPVLLFVPAGAFTAFVLRFLIPDMGRCRTAQILAIVAATLAVGRTVASLRWPANIPVEAMAILELLTCGLVLSAFQLQCRYVIHVNPNPPVAVRPQLGLPRPTADPVENVPSIEALPSETVDVPAQDEPEFATPQTPLTVGVDESVIPPAGKHQGGGNKPSRKKHRRAG